MTTRLEYLNLKREIWLEKKVELSLRAIALKEELDNIKLKRKFIEEQMDKIWDEISDIERQDQLTSIKYSDKEQEFLDEHSHLYPMINEIKRLSGETNDVTALNEYLRTGDVLDAAMNLKRYDYQPT